MRNLKHLRNETCWRLSKMPFGIGQLTSLQELDEFIVSGQNGEGGAGIEELQGLNLLRGRPCITRLDRGVGIEELQSLNLLKGKLSIEKLERVSTSMEAKAANLIGKESLSALKLNWSKREEEEVVNISSGVVDHEAIVEALHPPSNIRELWVKGYPGVKLPDWMKKNIGNFHHLTEMHLHDLPNLEEFPCTQSLTTSGLQVLSFIGCPKLMTPLAAAALINLTSLRKLEIHRCDSFTSLPKLGSSSSSLVELTLESCKALCSVSEVLQYQTSLQVLKISNCPECFDHLSADSIGLLRNLQTLDVSGNKLKMLPDSICDLTNLHTLELASCQGLEVLPKNLRNMRNLEHLGNKGCSKLSKMPFGIGQLTCLRRLDEFIVSGTAEDDIGQHEGGGAGIEELQGLNLLRGKLSITRLEKVSNSRDAKAANLISQKYLFNLELKWSRELGNISGGGVDHEGIMEALEPPSTIRKLTVEGYSGVKLPDWMKKNIGNFHHLREMHLHDLPNLEEFPWSQSLTTTGLKYLTLDKCPKLTPHAAAALVNLTSLSQLEIHRCDSLTSLRKLGIQEGSSSLLKLTIRFCNALSCVSEGLQYLTSLQFLTISNCPELEFSADCFDHLIALRGLQIRYCRKLISLPNGLQYLTSLQFLVIEGCYELEFSAEYFDHLIALQELKIRDCPKLMSLPDGLQHAATKTLERLSIYGCKNLVVLPDWLPRLSALRKLTISGCHPDLKTRCEKDNGPDWPKIAHIEKVRITTSLVV